MSRTTQSAGSLSPKHGTRLSLTQPLALMEEALRLLDQLGAPPEIGAQLDIAIHRLRNVSKRV